MKNKSFTLLYIGNKLQENGKTPTSIDTLAPQLEEICSVITCSDKENILHRMFDMIITILKYRKKVDAILIDTYSTTNFYYAFVASVFAKIFKIPYFPFLHGGNLPDRLQKTPHLSHSYFSGAQVNIAPSGYLLNVFKDAGYKVRFIPNNINLKDYPFVLRKDINASMLYVRAFSKIYNPSMAIKVLDRLKDEYPKSRLCMVGPDKGDGSFQESSNLAKKMNLSNRFEQTGKLTKKEWISLSKEYTFFVNPTNFDNLPVSVIEAMALGMIVISTNVGGLPFLIDDGVDGLLVNKDDDEMMYKKISQLMKSPEKCKEISRNARIKAETYDWVNVSKQWKNLFEIENN